MIYLLNTGTIIISFIGMEGVAWLLHKYVMHGFLWNVHKDHHIPHNKKLERNDFFALVFGIPSWLFMQFGIMAGCDWRLYVGIGITLYGICYMLVHEGLIHGRINILRHVKDYRLLALRNGHKTHHTHDKDADYKKENDVCYGMLWVPMKYFREAKRIQNSKIKA